MRTYTVWFTEYDTPSASDRCVFVSGIPGAALAERIAQALKEEGFVYLAWAEEE